MSAGTALPAGTIPPGATIGILGGGQLGRMTALAAARLGYHTHVFCQSAQEPAAQVARDVTLADFADIAALDRFAAACAVVTLEFENTPVAAVDRIAARTPVRPGGGPLRVAQHRVREKRLFADCGLSAPDWAAVDSAESLKAALAQLGGPAIVKTTRMGYDGKGQRALDARADAQAAWTTLWAGQPAPEDAEGPAVLEARVDFACEISVLIARSLHGETRVFPAAENDHEDGILRHSSSPALVAPAVAAAADAAARKLADRLDIVGLLAVEMFVRDRNGGAEVDPLLINEIAPRPHNSGHWTMDACRTDQFEQLIRAICGLPLGAVDRTADVVMTNLLGDEAEDWPALLADPAVKLHLYGKADARPGRKMGHANRLIERRTLPGPRLGGIES